MTVAGFSIWKHDFSEIRFFVSGAQETKRAYTDNKA